ncbi:periplasmic sugar-binding protein [Spiroplasma clarkii]|uniref:Ribose ABC transporter substrate-binding protein n=1 Tax=Spiroplasma clarkii TaxID=2139 RepID=A0A1Y0L0Y3_9MOLU|nr:substrate-binding domain-containing protein [Spiroplasma clarkii]ARU91378.1 periplasmic sugar-binding protein [Spiroplasma clarkii]ATX70796.1 ribose ABC transporter substrate-binding protein [Spiroplasma clarkii]
MKKLIMSLMGASILTSTAASVVACGSGGKTIGIVLSTTANPYFSKMKDVATDYLKDKEYSPVFYDSNDNTATEKTNIENGITKGHLGMIVNPNNAEAATNADPIISAKIPLVTVDREFDGKKGAASFVTDNTLEAKKLFDNIKAKISPAAGDKLDVYVLRGVSGADASNKRYKGFVTDNLSEINLLGTSENNFANWERNTAADKVATDITTVNQANVIFAENDEMAMGAYQALNTATNKDWFKTGYIIGFDGNDDTKASIAKWTEEAKENVFSTIEQDPEKMIKLAIDKMIELIEAEGEAATTYASITPVDGKLISGFPSAS